MSIYFSDLDEQEEIRDRQLIPQVGFALNELIKENNELKETVRQYLKYGSSDGNMKRQELRKKLSELVA